MRNEPCTARPSQPADLNRALMEKYRSLKEAYYIKAEPVFTVETA